MIELLNMKFPDCGLQRLKTADLGSAPGRNADKQTVLYRVGWPGFFLNELVPEIAPLAKTISGFTAD